MPGAITLTPDPDRARMGVRLDGFPDVDTQVARVVAGERVPLRAAHPAARPLGGTWFGWDYEAPLGVPVGYEASDGTSVVTAAPAVLTTRAV